MLTTNEGCGALCSEDENLVQHEITDKTEITSVNKHTAVHLGTKEGEKKLANVDLDLSIHCITLLTYSLVLCHTRLKLTYRFNGRTVNTHLRQGWRVG